MVDPMLRYAASFVWMDVILDDDDGVNNISASGNGGGG